MGLERRRVVVAAALIAVPAFPATAQQRSGENVVTQAEDGFGFSVGRESLGIYSSTNARGFSPVAAGNLRIDGLYFDQISNLQGTLLDSTSIKVGISAQGYPFAAPSGIADYALRLPSNKAGVSAVINADGYGTIGAEVDGSVPVSPRLAVGYGVNATHLEFADGTNNFNHNETLIARWRPSDGIEVTPFWSLWNDYNDEAGVFFLPAGDYLPMLPGPRRYRGPDWSDFRFTTVNAGLLASARLGPNWQLRLGAFRSTQHQRHGFTNIVADEDHDGSGDRLLFADPPFVNASTSGEVRLTHVISEGPRLHVIHLSVRERNARREFGGSALVDFGPGTIFDKITAPEPDFEFGDISHDRVRQTTLGLAYDGRWKNAGEVSFSLSQARFRKETFVPGSQVAISRSNPWLYNGTAAANVARSVTVYVGYARGLEESGIAPPNAANRNQPLAAVITSQKDAGVRISFGKLKAVAGVFDLVRPYFGYDARNIYDQIGTVRSRGAEFSVSGSLTPNLDMVAGGVLLDPKVTRDASALGNIGERPAGLSTHTLSLNLNWKTSIVRGLQLDAAVVQRGRTPATTDNLVYIPPRLRVDLGGHYSFKLARRSATLRLQVFNVTDYGGYAYNGPGVYGQLGGRLVQGYLTVDF